MKKIMFNDKYGLTQAVLEGRKTMTRRIVHKVWLNDDGSIYEHSESLYKIGEVVAVAQSYKDAGYASDTIQEGRAVRKSVHSEDWDDSMIGKLGDWYIDQLAGWNNKMFILPNLMPHQIRITDIKVEKLQEISDEDCLKEGIFECIDIDDCERGYTYRGGYWHRTPREAFAVLIDNVSGRGTWDSNPYVVAYSFELVQYNKGASK